MALRPVVPPVGNHHTPNEPINRFSALGLFIQFMLSPCVRLPCQVSSAHGNRGRMGIRPLKSRWQGVFRRGF